VFDSENDVVDVFNLPKEVSVEIRTFSVFLMVAGKTWK
jgi:hypothetical protein